MGKIRLKTIENEISKSARELCEKMAMAVFEERAAMLERLLLATIRGERLILRETRKNTWSDEIVYEYRFESPNTD